MLLPDTLDRLRVGPPLTGLAQGALSVQGGLTIDSGGLTITAGQLLIPSGSTAAPGIAFGAGPTKGLTLNGAGNVDMVLSGAVVFRFGPTFVQPNANVLFTDNAFDIGASGATRPRNIYVAGQVIASAGAGTGAYVPVGTISVQTSATGVGNGADTSDDVLFTYSLPLNSLAAGKSLRVRAWGKTAATANNKDIKLWFAGITLIDSGVIALNNSSWSIEYEITCIDTTHVSSIGTWSDNGLTTADVNTLPNQAVADLSANASVIRVTGASTVAGAASDVLGYGMKVWFEN